VLFRGTRGYKRQCLDAYTTNLQYYDEIYLNHDHSQLRIARKGANEKLLTFLKI
jgi:hypothetical protein